jgi:hypothetical protein
MSTKQTLFHDIDGVPGCWGAGGVAGWIERLRYDDIGTVEKTRP